jgi:hypothetical protein
MKVTRIEPPKITVVKTKGTIDERIRAVNNELEKLYEDISELGKTDPRKAQEHRANIVKNCGLGGFVSLKKIENQYNYSQEQDNVRV